MQQQEIRDVLWEYFWQTGSIGSYLLYRSLGAERIDTEPEDNPLD
ncbi:MAG: YqzL family protein [bacterium]